jgi:hypothetical protein
MPIPAVPAFVPDDASDEESRRQALIDALQTAWDFDQFIVELRRVNGNPNGWRAWQSGGSAGGGGGFGFAGGGSAEPAGPSDPAKPAKKAGKKSKKKKKSGK